jgi:thiosulfate reductase cytochrome b subunit
MNRAKILLLNKLLHWSLLVLIILYILTGFGITQFRIVEQLTMGLLTKNLSFKIHLDLIIPFIVLLVLHVYFSSLLKLRTK